MSRSELQDCDQEPRLPSPTAAAAGRAASSAARGDSHSHHAATTPLRSSPAPVFSPPRRRIAFTFPTPTPSTALRRGSNNEREDAFLSPRQPEFLPQGTPASAALTHTVMARPPHDDKYPSAASVSPLSSPQRFRRPLPVRLATTSGASVSSSRSSPREQSSANSTALPSPHRLVLERSESDPTFVSSAPSSQEQSDQSPTARATYLPLQYQLDTHCTTFSSLSLPQDQSDTDCTTLSSQPPPQDQSDTDCTAVSSHIFSESQSDSDSNLKASTFTPAVAMGKERWKEQRVQITRERDELKSELAHVKEKIGRLTGERDNLQEELVNYQNTLADYEDKIENLKANVESAAKIQKDLVAKNIEKDRQIEKLEEEQRGANASYQYLSLDNDETRADLEKTQAELGETHAHLQKLKGEVNAANAQEKHAKDQLAYAKSQIFSFANQVLQMRLVLDSLQAQDRIDAESAQQVDAAFGNYDKDLQELHKAQTSMQQNVERLEFENAALKTEMADLQRQREELLQREQEMKQLHSQQGSSIPFAPAMRYPDAVMPHDTHTSPYFTGTEEAQAGYETRDSAPAMQYPDDVVLQDEHTNPYFVVTGEAQASHSDHGLASAPVQHSDENMSQDQHPSPFSGRRRKPRDKWAIPEEKKEFKAPAGILDHDLKSFQSNPYLHLPPVGPPSYPGHNPQKPGEKIVNPVFRMPVPFTPSPLQGSEPVPETTGSGLGLAADVTVEKQNTEDEIAARKRLVPRLKKAGKVNVSLTAPAVQYNSTPAPGWYPGLGYLPTSQPLSAGTDSVQNSNPQPAVSQINEPKYWETGFPSHFDPSPDSELNDENVKLPASFNIFMQQDQAPSQNDEEIDVADLPVDDLAAELARVDDTMSDEDDRVYDTDMMGSDVEQQASETNMLQQQQQTDQRGKTNTQQVDGLPDPLADFDAGWMGEMLDEMDKEKSTKDTEGVERLSAPSETTMPAEASQQASSTSMDLAMSQEIYELQNTAVLFPDLEQELNDGSVIGICGLNRDPIATLRNSGENTNPMSDGTMQDSTALNGNLEQNANHTSTSTMQHSIALERDPEQYMNFTLDDAMQDSAALNGNQGQSTYPTLDEMMQDPAAFRKFLELDPVPQPVMQQDTEMLVDESNDLAMTSIVDKSPNMPLDDNTPAVTMPMRSHEEDAALTHSAEHSFNMPTNAIEPTVIPPASSLLELSTSLKNDVENNATPIVEQQMRESNVEEDSQNEASATAVDDIDACATRFEKMSISSELKDDSKAAVREPLKPLSAPASWAQTGQDIFERGEGSDVNDKSVVDEVSKPNNTAVKELDGVDQQRTQVQLTESLSAKPETTEPEPAPTIQSKPKSSGSPQVESTVAEAASSKTPSSGLVQDKLASSVSAQVKSATTEAVSHKNKPMPAQPAPAGLEQSMWAPATSAPVAPSSEIPAKLPTSGLLQSKWAPATSESSTPSSEVPAGLKPSGLEQSTRPSTASAPIPSSMSVSPVKKVTQPPLEGLEHSKWAPAALAATDPATMVSHSEMPVKEPPVLPAKPIPPVPATQEPAVPAVATVPTPSVPAPNVSASNVATPNSSASTVQAPTMPQPPVSKPTKVEPELPSLFNKTVQTEPVPTLPTEPVHTIPIKAEPYPQELASAGSKQMTLAPPQTTFDDRTRAQLEEITRPLQFSSRPEATELEKYATPQAIRPDLPQKLAKVTDPVTWMVHPKELAESEAEIAESASAQSISPHPGPTQSAPTQPAISESEPSAAKKRKDQALELRPTILETGRSKSLSTTPDAPITSEAKAAKLRPFQSRIPKAQTTTNKESTSAQDQSENLDAEAIARKWPEIAALASLAKGKAVRPGEIGHKSIKPKAVQDNAVKPEEVNDEAVRLEKVENKAHRSGDEQYQDDSRRENSLYGHIRTEELERVAEEEVRKRKNAENEMRSLKSEFERLLELEDDTQADLEDRITNLRSDLRKSREANSYLRRVAQVQREQYAGLNKKKLHLEGEVERLQKEASEARKQNDEAQSKLAEARAERLEAKKERKATIGQMDAEISRLQHKVEANDEEVDAMRRKLAADHNAALLEVTSGNDEDIQKLTDELKESRAKIQQLNEAFDNEQKANKEALDLAEERLRGDRRRAEEEGKAVARLHAAELDGVKDGAEARYRALQSRCKRLEATGDPARIASLGPLDVSNVRTTLDRPPVKPLAPAAVEPQRLASATGPCNRWHPTWMELLFLLLLLLLPVLLGQDLSTALRAVLGEEIGAAAAWWLAENSGWVGAPGELAG